MNEGIGGDTSQFATQFNLGVRYKSAILAEIPNPSDKILIGEKGYMGANGSASDWSDVRFESVEWNWANNNFDLSQAQSADNDQGSWTSSSPLSGAALKVPPQRSLQRGIRCDGHVKGIRLGQLGYGAKNATGASTSDDGLPWQTAATRWYPYAHRLGVPGGTHCTVSQYE